MKYVLVWKKTVVANDDFWTPTRILLPDQKVNNTAILSNIDFEFTERIYKIHFYGFLDLLSTIGGLRASLEPIFELALPLFIGHFLYSLAGVVKNKMSQNRLKEMLRLVKSARK